MNEKERRMVCLRLAKECLGESCSEREENEVADIIEDAIRAAEERGRQDEAERCLGLGPRAAHLRAAEARALREAADKVTQIGSVYPKVRFFGMAHVAKWLRALADEREKGE